jgi:hypothetical protein
VIHFLDPDCPEGEKIAAIGHWDRVVEIVGGLREEVDLYPQRYRVRAFPSEERLAELAAG